MKNDKKIMSLFEALRLTPKSCLSLPLPKRLALPEVSDLQDELLGDLRATIQTVASIRENYLSSHAANLIISKGLTEGATIPLNAISIEGAIISERFAQKKGRIFTLRGSLSKRLMDIDTGDEIPAKFLMSPFEACYIEFCESEDRSNFELTLFADGKESITEGAYCLQHRLDNGELLSQSAVEFLEIDRSLPVRIIEICFTGSPLYNKSSGKDPESVICDNKDSINFFIQDENEPLMELVKRHINYLSEKATEGSNCAKNEKFVQHMINNLSHLVKALIYINSDFSISEEDNNHSALKEKAKSIKNPDKLRKLKASINRTYDRILLGKNQRYIPLDDVFSKILKETGVKVHWRRGYFGVRWKGEKRAEKGISWTKPAIINADKIGSHTELLKDYDVL